MKHFLLLSLITLATSCNNSPEKQEVFPDEGVSTVKTNQGNEYSKYCIMKTCYCQKNAGYNSSVVVDCAYYDEVVRLYEKFNKIGQ
jgi:hypothetical protein